VRPTACVTGGGAGVDNAWEQEKLEASKCPKMALGNSQPPASMLFRGQVHYPDTLTGRFVRRAYRTRDSQTEKEQHRQSDNIKQNSIFGYDKTQPTKMKYIQRLAERMNITILSVVY